MSAHENNVGTPPFLMTAPVRAVLPELQRDFGSRPPFVLLTGDAGSGRSWLASEWIERNGERVVPVVLADPAPAAPALASALLASFQDGAEAVADQVIATEHLLDTLAATIGVGRVALVVVDDADRMDDAQLLELGRLADAAVARHLAFEVLLVGTPALTARFASPSLSALRLRVGAAVTLSRLSANDTREYLQTRLSPGGSPCTGRFSRKASRDIHQESLGLIAVVEAIAAEALRLSENLQVSPEHVRAAARAVKVQRNRVASVTRVLRTTLPPANNDEHDPVVVSEPPPAPVVAPATPVRAAAPVPQPAVTIEPDPSVPSPEAIARVANASHDERVQDWLSRFGGAGSIVIGAPASSGDVDEDELLAQVNAEAAAALVSSGDTGRGKGRRHAPRGAAPADGSRRTQAIAASLVFLLALGGIAVLAFAQRQALSRMFAGVFTDSRPAASSAPAVAAVPMPAPEPVIAAPDTVALPPMEYVIDAGHFTTRAQARAERNHLARLVSYEVAISDDAEGRHALWLGKFPSQATADSVLDALQGRGLLLEATVFGYPVITGDSTATSATTIPPTPPSPAPTTTTAAPATH
ncbi:MAG: hypothetical protein RL760_822 [Candidatus Eisenbacteria bacterium]